MAAEELFPRLYLGKAGTGWVLGEGHQLSERAPQATAALQELPIPTPSLLQFLCQEVSLAGPQRKQGAGGP